MIHSGFLLFYEPNARWVISFLGLVVIENQPQPFARQCFSVRLILFERFLCSAPPPLTTNQTADYLTVFVGNQCVFNHNSNRYSVTGAHWDTPSSDWGFDADWAWSQRCVSLLMRVISDAATSRVLKTPQAADETADGCGDEFRV